MSRSIKKIKRNLLAGLPLIKMITRNLQIHSIMSEYITSNGNEIIPVVDSLIFLIYNITLGRQPLYELKDWMLKLDSSICNFDKATYDSVNDDRFGRALDRLYIADRASLLTHIVINLIKKFEIDISRIHNDSTTLKAFGKIPGKTKSGFQIAHGKSKDHRPDLKQLLFTLSISADGAVPIHYKTYPGNRTDDTTHIETWDKIKSIVGKTDFVYVADSKVCTTKQLNYITSSGGKVITIIPETWKETKIFKEDLRKNVIQKQRIWWRYISYTKSIIDYFSVFNGEYFTQKHGFRIYWTHSSEKKKRDKYFREKALNKAENLLIDLNTRINKGKLKTYEAIHEAITKLLKKLKVERFLNIKIDEKIEIQKVQIGKGRPGKKTQYQEKKKITYFINFEKNKDALKKEIRVDGTFPILCTDPTITAKDALRYYKYQPRLEKRFTQLKSVHEGAPLLFKKIERVESIMFLFFISLIVQALIERQVRKNMLKKNIEALKIYPEARKASHPTTSKILFKFEDISTYQIFEDDDIIEDYKDELDEEHKQILELLGITEKEYWGKK